MAESRKQQQQPSAEMFYDSPSDAKEMAGGGRERRRGSLRKCAVHALILQAWLL